jgi:phosphoglycolate phosphatase-like HAD superfamily hydrolase
VSQPAVVVDIDNTLVDTAIRKLKILEHLGLATDRDLASVRQDYWLRRFLGDHTSPQSEEFFRKLERPESIENYSAELIPGARETLAWLLGRGFTVHYVSGRPKALKSVTLSELSRLGLVVKDDTLHLSDRGPGQISPLQDFSNNSKVKTIKALARTWDVLAMIGDQPEDVFAGNEAGVPTVLLTSTMTVREVHEVAAGSSASVVCASWPEVAIALARFESGGAGIVQQRQQLADQYAGWLGDIDEKSQTTVLIAGALSALTTPVLTSDHFSFRRDWLLVAALLFSIVSMVYAIRSFTSIYTSGKLTAREIPVRLKQWVAVLIGWPSSWKSNWDDAIGEYEALKKANNATKARAHLSFFAKRYGTIDPDVIMNMRLYAMRANNYAKVYPERLASKLLVLAILLSGIWIIFKVLDFDLSKHVEQLWQVVKRR